jgi:hypothetical protein
MRGEGDTREEPIIGLPEVEPLSSWLAFTQKTAPVKISSKSI